MISTDCPLATRDVSFSGTLAVTQTVLRSATVINAAVESFQRAPGATARSITLPDTGAEIVTVRDLLVVSSVESGSTPICRSRAPAR